MNIKFLQRKPRYQTLALAALASLAACSSTPDDGTGESLDSDQAIMEPSQTNTQAGGDLDLGDGSDTGADSSAQTDMANGGARKARPDRHFGQRRAPDVQHAPFQSEGRWMNGFYIVRSPSDSWETLSQLIYGRPDRADMISKWNQEGTLKVGRVVYYNSAIRPEDNSSMKVLAEDFNIPMEKVEVQKGDSLSAIGQRMYGDAQTWQELAALNPEITNPDVIQVGQTLNVQPAQLNTQDVLKQVIAQAGTAPTTDVAAAATATATTAQADQVPPTGQPAQADASAVPNQDEQSKSPTPAQGTVALSNPPASTGGSSTGMLTKLGGGLAALCLVALAMRRWLANKKARDDWSADGQMNVTKLSRPGN